MAAAAPRWLDAMRRSGVAGRRPWTIATDASVLASSTTTVSMRRPSACASMDAITSAIHGAPLWSGTTKLTPVILGLQPPQ